MNENIYLTQGAAVLPFPVQVLLRQFAGFCLPEWSQNNSRLIEFPLLDGKYR